MYNAAPADCCAEQSPSSCPAMPRRERRRSGRSQQVDPQAVGRRRHAAHRVVHRTGQRLPRRQGETARQRALRLALRRNDMSPIAELAKFKLRDVPEFAALMLPPAGAPSQTTIQAAYAMADAASAHAQTFIDNGLPATF